MAVAPPYFTWDGDPGESIKPRRPSTDDLGGDTKLDDQAFPPDDVEMPTAAGHNQQTNQIAGLAKIAPAAKITVEFTAGTPSITKFVAVGLLVTSGDITVTDIGDGDTELTWPADTFPDATVWPSAIVLHEGAPAPRSPVVTKITNGVKIQTWAQASAATDFAFTVTVEGQ